MTTPDDETQQPIPPTNHQEAKMTTTENSTASETDADQTDTPTSGSESKGNREAAKYRTQLRAAEAELAAARARAEAAQRVAVEAAAGARMYQPAALWAAGIALDDVLDAEGRVDTARLDEAIDRATTSLGLARRPRPDYSQGTQDSQDALRLPTFTDAFGPRR